MPIGATGDFRPGDNFDGIKSAFKQLGKLLGLKHISTNPKESRFSTPKANSTFYRPSPSRIYKAITKQITKLFASSDSSSVPTRSNSAYQRSIGRKVIAAVVNPVLDGRITDSLKRKFYHNTSLEQSILFKSFRDGTCEALRKSKNLDHDLENLSGATLDAMEMAHSEGVLDSMLVKRMLLAADSGAHAAEHLQKGASSYSIYEKVVESLKGRPADFQAAMKEHLLPILVDKSLGLINQGTLAPDQLLAELEKICPKELLEKAIKASGRVDPLHVIQELKGSLKAEYQKELFRSFQESVRVGIGKPDTSLKCAEKLMQAERHGVLTLEFYGKLQTVAKDADFSLQDNELTRILTTHYGNEGSSAASKLQRFQKDDTLHGQQDLFLAEFKQKASDLPGTMNALQQASNDGILDQRLFNNILDIARGNAYLTHVSTTLALSPDEIQAALKDRGPDFALEIETYLRPDMVSVSLEYLLNTVESLDDQKAYLETICPKDLLEKAGTPIQEKLAELKTLLQNEFRANLVSQFENEVSVPLKSMERKTPELEVRFKNLGQEMANAYMKAEKMGVFDLQILNAIVEVAAPAAITASSILETSFSIVDILRGPLTPQHAQMFARIERLERQKNLMYCIDNISDFKKETASNIAYQHKWLQDNLPESIRTQVGFPKDPPPFEGWTSVVNKLEEAVQKGLQEELVHIATIVNPDEKQIAVQELARLCTFGARSQDLGDNMRGANSARFKALQKLDILMHSGRDEAKATCREMLHNMLHDSERIVSDVYFYKGLHSKYLRSDLPSDQRSQLEDKLLQQLNTMHKLAESLGDTAMANKISGELLPVVQARVNMIHASIERICLELTQHVEALSKMEDAQGVSADKLRVAIRQKITENPDFIGAKECVIEIDGKKLVFILVNGPDRKPDVLLRSQDIIGKGATGDVYRAVSCRNQELRVVKYASNMAAETGALANEVALSRHLNPDGKENIGVQALIEKTTLQKADGKEETVIIGKMYANLDLGKQVIMNKFIENVLDISSTTKLNKNQVVLKMRELEKKLHKDLEKAKSPEEKQEIISRFRTFIGTYVEHFLPPNTLKALDAYLREPTLENYNQALDDINSMLSGLVETFSKRHIAVSPSSIASTASQLCLGMLHLQVRKVLHGDIKPLNIFWNTTQAVIADYDSAVKLESLQKMMRQDIKFANSKERGEMKRLVDALIQNNSKVIADFEAKNPALLNSLIDKLTRVECVKQQPDGSIEPNTKKLKELRSYLLTNLLTTTTSGYRSELILQAMNHYFFSGDEANFERAAIAFDMRAFGISLYEMFTLEGLPPDKTESPEYYAKIEENLLNRHPDMPKRACELICQLCVPNIPNNLASGEAFTLPIKQEDLAELGKLLEGYANAVA